MSKNILLANVERKGRRERKKKDRERERGRKIRLFIPTDLRAYIIYIKIIKSCLHVQMR